MPEFAIETEEISKSFGGACAVQSLSLRVPRGSVYGFLGPNGAGKSTTIRMLLGLLRPDRGTVRLLGEDIASERLRVLARTGSLVENPSVYPHLTAEENLDIPRRLLGAPKTDISRVLEIVGLAQARSKLVRTFSLGMKQRLGLAQALLGRRELLILDEPTNGLDPSGMNDMRRLIQGLVADSGLTVFLSSHLLSEVEQMATHIGVLSRGTLVFQGTSGEITEKRSPRLRIRTSHQNEARRCLAALGWNAEVDKDDLLLPHHVDAARVSRALITAGCEVSHLALESMALETVFLGLTRAEPT